MSTKKIFQQTISSRGTERGAVRLGLVLIALLFMASLALPPAAQAAELALQHIDYTTLPGEKVQLRLELSGPAPKPGTFTIDNPARIALDLPNTHLATASKSRDIGVGAARSVRAVEANGRTRVVVNLVRMVPYDVTTDGKNILVTLEPPTNAGTGARATAATAASITNIDFKRGEHGEGRIVVTLSEPSVSFDMSEKGNQILVDFLSTTVPQKLVRRLNVVDFATPVTTIDTVARGNDVRMQINTVGDSEHIAYQTGKTFTIEVQPVTKAKKAAAAKGKPKYTGERLSLNFQNIEVRAVLQLLADFTGLNIVTSDTVQGNITLRLKNVPWDQAMDIILKSKGLGMRKMGNVILVAPAEEIAAREKMELEAKKQIRELAPLRNENIQINYAKASDIAALLKSKSNSLLSERGNVTIDQRTNKLLVQDTAENLDAIRKLVEELDIPVRQVLIESRVVLATDDFSHELGARFGITDTRKSGVAGSGGTAVTSGNLNATTDVLNGDTVAAPDRWNVNLPVTNLASTAGSLGLAVAKLPLGALIELELSAAQAEGRSETISSPRVITANQKEATIEQGVEIPYQEATSSGATSVTFKKAVLSLKVTPQITPDDRIIMDLAVNKDNADFSNAVLGQPPINTQAVTTQVLVDNGETIVLGGVYEQTKSHQVNRVPFFGDLPVLGVLFRNKFQRDDKSELLIFVTPKILKQGATLQ